MTTLNLTNTKASFALRGSMKVRSKRMPWETVSQMLILDCKKYFVKQLHILQ